MFYFYRFKRDASPVLIQKGMSLLETAIGLVIIGLIILPIFRTYSYKHARKVYETNLGALNEAIEGINQFFVSGNSAYPCPADLSLKPGDTDFGKTGDCSNLGNIRPCDNPTWFTNGGICKTTGTDEIIIGGLPFSSLKMPEEDSFDFWGNKLIYAVTHDQTDTATYVANNGKIRIMSIDDPALVAAGPPSDPDRDGIPDLVPGAYDIFIFSTGENGVGGFTRTGQRLETCGDATDGYEHENCDFDDVFFALEDPNNSDISCYSKVAGTGYFDDATSEQKVLPVGTWYQHDKNPVYANADFVLTQATKVGIGTTTPNQHDGKTFPAVNLMVEGDIRAEFFGGKGGHVRSDSICDDTGTTSGGNCFNPNIITDAVDDMNCIESPSYASGAVRGVKNISNSSVYCGGGLNKNGTLTGNAKKLKVDSTKFTIKDCSSAGMVAEGIDVNGELICVMYTP
jgi:type II secretory pathway pseudopilin PulG